MSWHQLDNKGDHRSFNMSDGTSFTCIVILLNFCKSVKAKKYRTKCIFHFLFKKLISRIFFPVGYFKMLSVLKTTEHQIIRCLTKWFGSGCGLIKVLSQHGNRQTGGKKYHEELQSI